MDTTARLLLQKPNSDPVLGDDVDIDILNANADKIDAVISATPCTFATRPASPFQGQIILETDTGKMYVRLGSSWIQVFAASASGLFLLSNGEVNVTRAAATDTVLYGQVSGDSVGRIVIRADGQIQIGPGNAARDVNLYRRSLNHLGTDDSFQAGGYCSGAATESVRTTASAGITTTETVIQSVTFTAVSGAGYIVDALQHVQSTVANDTAMMRLRWAAGASVTSAGTLLLTILPNCDVAGKGQPWSMRKLLVPNVTGQVTVGVTLVRDGGTGTISSSGQANRIENTITVTGA